MFTAFRPPCFTPSWRARIAALAMLAACAVPAAAPAATAVRGPRAALVPTGAARTPHALTISSGKLNFPRGMTIAPNGDLYVANYSGSSISVYGSNLIQKTAATITSGINAPLSLAFNAEGQLYVGNFGSNQITVYDQKHNLLTNRTAPFNGLALALDALDDLYVVGIQSPEIACFRADGAFEGQFTAAGISNEYAIATSRHFIAYGGYNSSGGPSTFYTYVTNQLIGMNQATAPGYPWQGGEPSAMAFDANERLYIAEFSNKAVGLFVPLQNIYTARFVGLNFTPWGIAVDSAHNHLFVADASDNAIAVYTLGGAFVTTLY